MPDTAASLGYTMDPSQTHCSALSCYVKGTLKGSSCPVPQLGPVCVLGRSQPLHPTGPSTDTGGDDCRRRVPTELLPSDAGLAPAQGAGSSTPWCWTPGQCLGCWQWGAGTREGWTERGKHRAMPHGRGRRWMATGKPSVGIPSLRGESMCERRQVCTSGLLLLALKKRRNILF